MVNGAAPVVAVASTVLRSMLVVPGPRLTPFGVLMFHCPTAPTKLTMPPAPNVVMVVPPLLSWSAMVAIAFDANPAASNGPAASAIAVRTFLFISLTPGKVLKAAIYESRSHAKEGFSRLINGLRNKRGDDGSPLVKATDMGNTGSERRVEGHRFDERTLNQSVRRAMT